MRNKTKVIFISLILIETIIYCIAILNIDYILTEKIILSTIIYILSIVGTIIALIYFQEKHMSYMNNKLDKIVEDAIRGENFEIEYNETEVSRLEYKLLRYIRVKEVTQDNIEEERNRIRTLVSDISHQTKTPISNIMLYNSLLLESESLTEDEREMALDINKQVDRLNWLIQGLVKMSRLETGMITVSKEKLSIKETIDEAINKIALNYKEKDIEIENNIYKDINIKHDRKWSVEAFVNVLENSIKYTDRSGKIKVSLVEYELFARIDISDNGIGIEENEINNIFKRFYRCKNARFKEGVGIGLYLTREIITMQGGYLKVTSQVGKGTTVSIFLPSNI